MTKARERHNKTYKNARKHTKQYNVRSKQMRLQQHSLFQCCRTKYFFALFWFNFLYFLPYPFCVSCIISYLFIHVFILPHWSLCTTLWVIYFAHVSLCLMFCLFKKDIILSGVEKEWRRSNDPRKSRFTHWSNDSKISFVHIWKTKNSTNILIFFNTMHAVAPLIRKSFPRSIFLLYKTNIIRIMKMIKLFWRNFFSFASKQFGSKIFSYKKRYYNFSLLLSTHIKMLLYKLI